MTNNAISEYSNQVKQEKSYSNHESKSCFQWKSLPVLESCTLLKKILFPVTQVGQRWNKYFLTNYSKHKSNPGFNVHLGHHWNWHVSDKLSWYQWSSNVIPIGIIIRHGYLLDPTPSALVSAYQFVVYKVHKCRTKSWLQCTTQSPPKMAWLCQVMVSMKQQPHSPYRLDHCQNESLSDPCTHFSISLSSLHGTQIMRSIDPSLKFCSLPWASHIYRRMYHRTMHKPCFCKKA